MIKILATLFLFVNADPEKISGKVIRVIDGNTIEILDPEKEVIKVMLSEVDCPEAEQEFGAEATKFTEKLVLKKRVVVEIIGKDRWGNKMAQVTLNDGKSLQHEIVRNGLGWHKEEADKTLALLQSTAKANKTGLWAKDDPTPPWIFRRQQTMLKPKGR